MQMNVLAGITCGEYNRLPANFDKSIYIKEADTDNVFYVSGHEHSFYPSQSLFLKNLQPCRPSEDKSSDYETLYKKTMTQGNVKAEQVFDNVKSLFPDLLSAPNPERHVFLFKYDSSNTIKIKLVAKYFIEGKKVYHFVPEKNREEEMNVYVDTSRRRSLVRRIINCKASDMGQQIPELQLNKMLLLTSDGELERAEKLLDSVHQISFLNKLGPIVTLVLSVSFFIILFIESFFSENYQYTDSNDWFPGLRGRYCL